jgi:hypothetical protein
MSGREGEVVVSLLPSALKPSPAAAGRRGRRPALASWLVLTGYLLGAVAVTWRLWADPASLMPIGRGNRDVDLFAWFVRLEATAVSHGTLPGLVSTAMNAPHGISLLWNTSLLLPGVVLSPLSLLAGPQTTLTAVMTLGFAGSAASLFWVLRRWDASVSAAALGGAVYGFSPALLDAGMGHYHLEFAVFPPLIIDALLRLVTGRGRPLRTGAWLGVLIAAQLLTGEELLTDTAVAAAVLLVVVAAGRPRAVPGQLRAAAGGLAMTAGVALLLCGYPLWEQFRGPFSQHGSPWPTSPFHAHPVAFVAPPTSLLFHTQASAATAAANYGTNLAEYLGYLGWPLLIVLLAATLACITDPKIRAVALTWLILEVFTLGSGSAALPWHYLQHLPVLSQVLPNRLAIPADGAAAALLAFALDRTRRAVPDGPRWRTGLIAGVAVLAVLPLVPRPYRAVPVAPVPSGWQSAFSRLRLAADAPVLVVPVPYGRNTDPLRWQSETGVPGSLIGGYFIAPNSSGQAAEYGGRLPNIVPVLDSIWAGKDLRAPPIAAMRAAVASWHPAAVVAAANLTSPLGHILVKVFGPPAFQVGRMLAWRR